MIDFEFLQHMTDQIANKKGKEKKGRTNKQTKK